LPTRLRITPEFLPHVFEKFVQTDGSLNHCAHVAWSWSFLLVMSLRKRITGTIEAEAAALARASRFTLLAAPKKQWHKRDGYISRRARKSTTSQAHILIVEDVETRSSCCSRRSRPKGFPRDDLPVGAGGA
jgi:hypothetical protein